VLRVVAALLVLNRARPTVVTSKPRKGKTVYRHESLSSFQSNLENFILAKTLNSTRVFHDHSLSVDEIMTRSVSCSGVIGMIPGIFAALAKVAA
jgi:hypothetical protein